MILRCGAKKPDGNPCQRSVKIEGIRCYQHKMKEDVCSNKDVKPEELPESKDDYCLDCGAEEEWKSMECCISKMYVISSLGRCWSYRQNRLLKGGDNSPHTYRIFKLRTDDGKPHTKNIHAWQGIVFCGLPFIDKNSERDHKKELTMDHIDSKRKKDNFICCNLIPATTSGQRKNQVTRFDRQGKMVLKLSLTGEIIEEFVNIKEAAKDMNVDPPVITRRCNSGKILYGYKFKYLTKFDFPNQRWLSTSELFPDNDVLEVSSGGYIHKANGTIFKGSECGDYLHISWKNSKTGRTFTKSVHILIWEVFNKRRVKKGFQIHHINGEGDQNFIENLAEVTRAENIRESKASGKNKSCRKVRRVAHDGTHKDFISIHEAARETDKAHTQNICKFFQGKQKSCGLCKCGKRFTWIALDDNSIE